MRNGLLVILACTLAILFAASTAQAQSAPTSDTALISLLREAEANVKSIKARLKARNIVVKGKNVYRLVPLGDKK